MCCGIPVEKGCFVFSTINVVICGLGFASCLGFFLYLLHTWSEVQFHNPSDMVVYWVFTGIISACCIGAAIALIFAILLCVGLRKNNTCYVMAYLIYGIITVILSVMCTLAFIWTEWYRIHFVMYAMIPLGVCVLYSLMLLLVYQTYVVLSERAPITKHGRLLNTDDSEATNAKSPNLTKVDWRF